MRLCVSEVTGSFNFISFTNPINYNTSFRVEGTVAKAGRETHINNLKNSNNGI